MDRNDDRYEVRVWWDGGLVLNENHFKMIKFELEMKEHFRREHEEHELKMFALKYKYFRSLLGFK